MRFRPHPDAAKKEIPRPTSLQGSWRQPERLYFAWKDRPACRRQNEDMVLLAHIRSAFALSRRNLRQRPRMTPRASR